MTHQVTRTAGMAALTALLLLTGCGSTGTESAPVVETETVSGTTPTIESADKIPVDTENRATGTDATTAPDITEPVLADTKLPAYDYQGGEPYVADICAWMLSLEPGDADTDVTIPCPLILEIDDSDPQDILVWGNFWLFSYTLRNTTLFTTSGGEIPGLLHLKTVDGGFEAASFDQVGDGSDYDPDVRRIFGMREGLLQKFYDSGDERDAVRVQYISDYVNWNGLTVTQYQDFGWEPVALLNAPPTAEADQIVHLVSPLGYSIDYDLRELSFNSFGDSEESLSGVEALQGCSMTFEQRSNASTQDLVNELSQNYEQPITGTEKIGADGLDAEVISDGEGQDEVLKKAYVLALESGGCLIVSVRNTYYATPGDPVVPGADAVLEKTLQTFRLS